MEVEFNCYDVEITCRNTYSVTVKADFRNDFPDSILENFTIEQLEEWIERNK
jgi:hypothetical protein